MKIFSGKLIKIITISLILLLAFIFAGCKSENKTAATAGPYGLKIVATAFPQLDFAREIKEGSNSGTIYLLIKPGSEAHSYEPSPADIIEIQNCDLFICIGGESEAWVDKILNSMDKKKAPAVLSLIDMVEPLKAEHEHGTGNDSHKPVYDEHVWTSPENAIKMVRIIGEKMCELDAERADIYRENIERYTGELDSLSEDFSKAVKSSANKPLVFGDRFPFAYLAHEYGLDCLSAFPGCSSQTEASAATIVSLIDTVKKNKLPVVFTVDFSNEKIAQTIAAETGAKILSLHSCHTVSSDDFEAGVTYLDLMRRNLANITEALSE